jgi:hypothetical protein
VARELTADGTCVEIATGAMLPAGTDTIVRAECSVRADGLVRGEPRPRHEWRSPGEEARRDDVLAADGTPVTPALIGLAAACGYDELRVRSRPQTAVVISGNELLTTGAPAGGRIRDALGPQLPAWLRRLGGAVAPDAVIGPVGEARQTRVAAIRQALRGLSGAAGYAVIAAGETAGAGDRVRFLPLPSRPPEVAVPDAGLHEPARPAAGTKMKRFKYRALVKLDSAGGGGGQPPLPATGGRVVVRAHHHDTERDKMFGALIDAVHGQSPAWRGVRRSSGGSNQRPAAARGGPRHSARPGLRPDNTGGG